MKSYKFWHTPEQTAADADAKVAKTKADRMAQFRKRRDERLAECDWTQLADSPLSAEQRAAWADYRQALRDVPETVSADGWVEWPKRPMQ